MSAAEHEVLLASAVIADRTGDDDWAGAIGIHRTVGAIQQEHLVPGLAGTRIIQRRGIAGENNAPGAGRVQRGHIGDIQRPIVSEDGIAGESRRRPLHRQATRAVFIKDMEAPAGAQQTTGHECVTVTTEGRTATRRGNRPGVVAGNREKTRGTVVNRVNPIAGETVGQDIQAITIASG